jgi:hypothetical protein
MDGLLLSSLTIPQTGHMKSAVSIPRVVNSTHVQRGECICLAFSNPRVVAVVVGVVRVVFSNGAQVGELDPESRGDP